MTASIGSTTKTASTKPIVHFIHGNSFPSGTYKEMFKELTPHYDVQALDMHGHNPEYPVTQGWPFLVQEVIDTLTARYQEPVILLGHSLGGILALMAAHQRPDLVRCVVMIDSPILTGWRSLFLRVFTALGLLEKYSPARFSEKRRNHWNSAEEAYSHFASKEKFAIWPPQVLRDYIEQGVYPGEDGVHLKFSREIETEIYTTLPVHLGRIVKDGVKVPIGFVGGTESVECRQCGLSANRKICGDNFVQLKAGHLLPMEIPQETGQAVLGMIERLLK